MKSNNRVFALIFTLVFISGCATNSMSNQNSKALCAVAGAAVGGAAGKIIEDEPEGVAVGAVAGGLIAWLVCGDKDEDGDGVIDGKDRCRGTPRGEAVNSNGCPVDSDGDGVPDSQDRCANTVRGMSVDAQGCALDSDGDGVSDGKDRCPSTPKGTAVDGSGCPRDMDSDGDRVLDKSDRCADTPSGAAVNAEGCHTVFSLQGVNFATNSSVLTQVAKTDLAQAVKMLTQNPGMNVRVEGHTDSTGEDSYNMMLSKKRAQAVVDYLVMNGVNRSRLAVKGYGEGSPVASNKTAEGRASNRRVEFVKNN